MTDESSDKKAGHVQVFILANGTGIVDQEKSMEFFRETLQNYTNRFNNMVEALRPAIKDILEAEPGEFMLLDDLKYSARKALAEKGFDIAADELADLIDSFNKNHYLAIRRGRSGGIQMFDNAVNIIARLTADGEEVTDAVRESARMKILQDS